MIRERPVSLLAFTLLIGWARGDVEGFYNFLISREDPCVGVCLGKIPLTFVDSEYLKSCCERGCRFFNLVDLKYGLELDSLNGTRDACEASCTEAYTVPQPRLACSIGCELMADQRLSDLLSLFSMAIYDIPEIDILSDPGLRKELLPLWWDSNGFKLPQTFVKTVPLDAGTVDYGMPSDYSGESDQSGTLASNWLVCPSRHTGVPLCLLASVIVATALYSFWLCLCAEKTNSHYKEILVDRPDLSAKLQLYIPDDDAPLLKQPPPKYFEAVDTANVKV